LDVRNDMADPLEAACLLVGRFMYHFALVEQKFDQAVIKLLSLDEKCAPMVGLMDFAKKVEDLVRATSVLQATRRKDKDLANDVCDRAHTANRYRRIVAHASFKPAPGGGVLFSRAVTKKGLVRPVSEPWTDTDFDEHYAEMTSLEADLDKLISLIKPVKQIPFDWYVPWQSYHGSTPLTLR
jgi:hypothetical protein